jgi:glycosyltransferase involved in cell wall biosynthesis
VNDTILVMPAYNAARTVAKTLAGLPPSITLKQVILCDDASQDSTYETAHSLGIEVYKHARNRGYGGNQKTLYEAALKHRPKYIVMIHPDNQYDADAIPEMVRILESNEADFVLGNRMEHAKRYGMPWWKIAANKYITWNQNRTYQLNMSEYHSGLRAYRAEVILNAPLERFSENFVFDSEMIAWAVANGFRFAETPVKCYYTDEASQTTLKQSLRYGFDTLRVLRRFKQKEFHLDEALA